MTVIVPDLGELEMLRWTLKEVPAEYDPLHLHLYKNDYDPDRESVLEAFTEATYSGYAPQEMNRADWSNPVLVNGVAYSFYGATPFTFLTGAGEQLIYGFYVTGNDDAVVIWAARLPTAVLVTTSQPLVLQPYMRAHSEVEPEPPPPPPPPP